jgi:hypothetical protein
MHPFERAYRDDVDVDGADRCGWFLFPDWRTVGEKRRAVV